MSMKNGTYRTYISNGNSTHTANISVNMSDNTSKMGANTPKRFRPIELFTIYSYSTPVSMKKTCQEIYYYKFNDIFEGCVKLYL